MENTQTKQHTSEPQRRRKVLKVSNVALNKVQRDKVVLVRQVLQKKLTSQLAQGTKKFSVDSLLHPSDWQCEPLVGLFKGDIGKCVAGLVLKQLMDESGVSYRATWYDKADDPRGRARLYVLKG